MSYMPAQNWGPKSGQGMQAQQQMKNQNTTMGSQNDPNQAGVGLWFNHDSTKSYVYVKDIIKGRSADREGTVQPGDIVKSIDGQPVGANTELDALRDMVVGEVGTFVSMALERPEDNDCYSAYEVSLMRGNEEYFAQLKAKNQMQEEVESLRRRLGMSEEELETLRKALRMAEGQGGRDKEALDRLNGLLRSAEEQLKTVQATLHQEMVERRTMEARIASRQAQADQESVDLERLRNLLNQADEKLAAANQSLEVTRRQKNEQDTRYREEQQKRQEAESREKQFVVEMEERMEQDRQYREEQEQQLLALEEERRNYERLLREEQNATDAEKRRREAVEMRTDKAEQSRSTISQDNDRLLHMLKEAEDARSTIEQARAETEQKNLTIVGEVKQIEEQGVARQQYIDELKTKLEQERARWEGLLRSEQEGRKEDNTKYKAREEELLEEINTFNAGMRDFKEESEDKRRKLETNVMRLEQESKSVEAALKAEESLAEALRERLGVLADQLSRTEEELAQGRHDRSAAQSRLQQFETEKLRTLERERAMDAELQKIRDAEQEKIDAVEMLKRKLHDERMDRERHLHEYKAQARDAIASKQEAEHMLRRAQDEGQRMVDNERRRLEREQRFRKSHEEQAAKLEASLANLSGLKTSLANVEIPVKDYEKYLDTAHVFDDTAPRVSRDPGAESPPPASQLERDLMLVNGPTAQPVVHAPVVQSRGIDMHGPVIQHPQQGGFHERGVPMHERGVPMHERGVPMQSYTQGGSLPPYNMHGGMQQRALSPGMQQRALSPQPMPINMGGSFAHHPRAMSPTGGGGHTAYLLQQGGGGGMVRPSMSKSYDAAAYERREAMNMRQSYSHIHSSDGEKVDVA